MTPRQLFPVLLVATATSVLLAACGGSSSKDPSAGEPDDAKQEAFADCMRKAGLHAKTTDGGRGMAIQIPKGVSPARLQKIQRDCARKTGGGPHEPSKAEKAKFLDQALKFARCMRAHGINIPDPQADGGGIRIGGPSSGGSGGETFDPRAPAFQRAQRACESFLPGGKGKGGPALSTSGGKQRGGDTGPSVHTELR